MTDANPTRKPAARATASRERVRLPLPDVRRQMWEQACELVVAGESRRVSCVLANRFRTSERIIQHCLIVEGMRHERIAATLRTGVVNALELAREAGAAVDNEEFLAA
jgi:hypothetical protein